MAQKRRKQPGGGNRMAELGYMPVQVWLDKEEMQIIKQASEKDGRPITRFVVRAALAAANAMLGK